jgi:predicted transcriptional regulator of viral defense system
MMVELQTYESTVIKYQQVIPCASRIGETMPKARDYITDLAASGRYHFAAEEMRKALGVSADAAKLSLYRLAKRGFVASPARGFYIIVPPEYKRLGSLPADQFLPALMEWRKTRYYAGLLTAAQYHGAAHQRPQEFQVMVEKNQRPIECGSVRVSFIARKKMRGVLVQSFNTPRGTILVSSVEATAVDLAGYPHHAGGLDQVATILAELAEKIDPKLLAAAAKTAPLPWAQRLGYLLEQVGAKDCASLLKAYVQKNARDWAQLVPGARRARARRADDWLLQVNTEVESEA